VRVTVRVPATSANLGPGFDCFGLALELWNEVVVDTDVEAGVEWIGEGAGELPTDGTDLIRRSMRRAIGDRPLPSFHMRATNRVPLARGLGSSSAAVVAGVASALALAGDDASPQRVFALAAEIEGHPDNAAPACFGGFTVAMADGTARRLDPHPGIRPVALVPRRLRLPTHEARAALPPRRPARPAARARSARPRARGAGRRRLGARRGHRRVRVGGRAIAARLPARRAAGARPGRGLARVAARRAPTRVRARSVLRSVSRRRRRCPPRL
jgi:homoserine kinase